MLFKCIHDICQKDAIEPIHRLLQYIYQESHDVSGLGEILVSRKIFGDLCGRTSRSEFLSVPSQAVFLMPIQLEKIIVGSLFLMFRQNFGCDFYVNDNVYFSLLDFVENTEHTKTILFSVSLSDWIDCVFVCTFSCVVTTVYTYNYKIFTLNE
jgi:hypothetical protein